MRKKPRLQKDQLDELWDEMIGTNGKGMVSVVRKNTEDIGEIKEDVAYVKGKLDGGGGPSRNRIMVRKIIESAIYMGIFAVIVIVVVLVFAGRLDVEDVINILRAYKE